MERIKTEQEESMEDVVKMDTHEETPTSSTDQLNTTEPHPSQLMTGQNPPQTTLILINNTPFNSTTTVDSSPLIQPSAMETGDRNKESLKLKLLSRRPMSTLVEQGILPPLKTPPAYSGQRVKLERARMSDLLKAKIQQRPGRQELIRQHILEDTNSRVAPSLAEAQRMLKRARLADSLNDHLIHRPGPLELVKKNILHAPHADIEMAIKEGVVEFRATSEGHIPGPHILHGPQHSSNLGHAISEPIATGATATNPPCEAELSEDESSSSDLSSPSPLSAQLNSNEVNSRPSEDLQQVSTPKDPSIQVNTSNQVAQQVQLQQTPRVTSYSNKPHACKSRSSKKSTKQSTSKSNSSSQVNSTTQQQPTKARQIKFHEYKGPPSATKSNTSSSSSSIPATNPESSNDGSSTDTSTTSYDLLLQQQQLFLQWQLETRHKYPQLILPAPPSQTLNTTTTPAQQQQQQLRLITQSPSTTPSNTHFIRTLSFSNNGPSSTSTSPSPTVVTPIRPTQQMILPKLEPAPTPPTPQIITVSALVEKYNRNSNGTIPIPSLHIPIKPKPNPQPTLNTTQETTPVTTKPTDDPKTAIPDKSLHEMKVSDLRAECKRRNLPVSGPKPTLLERLRQNNSTHSTSLQDECVSSTNKQDSRSAETKQSVDEGLLREQEAQILQLQQALNNSQEQLMRMKNGSNNNIPNGVSANANQAKTAPAAPTAVAPGQTHRLALQQHLHQKMQQQKIQAQIQKLIQAGEPNNSTPETQSIQKQKGSNSKLKSTMAKGKQKGQTTPLSNNTITLHKSTEDEPANSTNSIDNASTSSTMDEHAWLLKINPEPLQQILHPDLNDLVVARKGVVLEYKSFFENYGNQASPGGTPNSTLTQHSTSSQQHNELMSELIVEPSSSNTPERTGILGPELDLTGLDKNQMMDDVLEILIRNGELPASAAHDPAHPPVNTLIPPPAPLNSTSTGCTLPPPPPPLPPPSFSVTLPTSISFSRPSALQSSQEAADILKISQDLSNFGNHKFLQAYDDQNKLENSSLTKFQQSCMSIDDIDMMEETSQPPPDIHMHPNSIAHDNMLTSHDVMDSSQNTLALHPDDVIMDHMSHHGLVDDEMPMEMDYSDWLDNLLPPATSNNNNSSYLDYGLLGCHDDGDKDYDPLLSSRSGFQAVVLGHHPTDISTPNSDIMMSKRSPSPLMSLNNHDSSVNHTSSENIWDFI